MNNPTLVQLASGLCVSFASVGALTLMLECSKKIQRTQVATEPLTTPEYSGAPSNDPVKSMRGPPLKPDKTLSSSVMYLVEEADVLRKASLTPLALIE